MLKKFTVSLSALLMMFVPTLLPAVTMAASTAASEAICEGANDGTGDPSCSGDTAGNTVSGIVRAAIRIFQGIIGIISLFVMLTGGLNYITSGGDSAKTKSARERIMYAVIGLVVVGIAEILVQFALNRVRDAA